jgi:BirA family biotin operon repressor/biotin-[acetyl-CoA-carboxylase] ligase
LLGGRAVIELESRLELIDLDSIRAQLDNTPQLDSFEWQYRQVTESTNGDALKLFETSRRPCIALAEMQTGGRGRRGRQWLSPFAKNIYCTIGMLKSTESCNPGLLSIVTGIALAETLAKTGIDGVKLKWPNDLVYQNQKLGGILIESKSITRQIYFFAIGFGINVAMNAKDLAAIPQPATSVSLIAGSSISRDRILVEAIRQVVTAVDAFDQSSVSRVMDNFHALDALRGQTITVKSGDGSIRGLNLGINADGQLQLETEQGRQEFSAADISIGSIA